VVEREPETKLTTGFSSDAAVATEWAQGRRDLEEAELYWLSTVRPDGRPHVTPLLGIWLDGALYFCTGPDERKAKNLEQNQQCIVTTGSNNLDGLDLVIEGEAAKVSDEPELRTVADTYEAKYGARLTAREDVVRSGRRHQVWGSPGLQGRSVHGLGIRQGENLQPDAMGVLLEAGEE
jgi:pyridoxine/pyridoxamine 5'-phosphate oxidase